MIRPYKNKDKEQLLSIMRSLVPKYFSETEIKDYEHYLDSEIDCYFVYEIQGQIVAGAGINRLIESRETRMSWDLVHPDFQGKRIGRELLLYRIIWAQEYAEYPIVVRTSQMAYEFYMKSGFELKEIQKDYWAEGYDLYYMIFKPKHT